MMKIKRRQLLKATALGSAALASGLAPKISSAQDAQASTVEPMRVLILGGTGFIGPHMVAEALRRGHDVTLFNRGRTNNKLFPDLQTLIGDRNNDLDSLKGQTWDVVIDNSGYVPRHVADSARLLASAASHYLYTSTISVYASMADPIDEDAPLARIADESVEEITNATYGPLKALCEKRVAEEFGEDRLAILRPTYICGPGDRTDRFTYWPARTLLGGEMLWPGTADDKIQIIDVRDLANFAIDVCEKSIVGTYNTVTPAGSFSMGDLMADSLAVTGSDMTPIWIDYDFLETQEKGEGNPLPIWSPPLPENAGDALVNGERAIAKGLKNRPTRETTRDTVTWWKTLPDERRAKTRAGLSPAIEAELLKKWRAKNT